jgi:hypothetical protein
MITGKGLINNADSGSKTEVVGHVECDPLARIAITHPHKPILFRVQGVDIADGAVTGPVGLIQLLWDRYVALLLTAFNIVNDNAIPLIGMVFEKLMVNLAILVSIVGIFIRKGKNQAIRIVVFDHIAVGIGRFAVMTMFYQWIC